MRMTIGMRYIKTGIAVTLCLLIANALHSEYPFFAAIAAVISMESTVTSSFITGKTRMMGTFLGAVIGLVFVLIQPENALLAGLGVIVIIFISNLMGWLNSISIATIVFLAIMLNLDGENPLMYSINRMEDTLLGVSVALAVNYLVFPYNIGRHLLEGEAALKARLCQAIRQRFCMGEAVDLDGLLQEIVQLETLHDLYVREFRLGKKDKPELTEVQMRLPIYRDFYAHLKMLSRLEGAPCLDPANTERINALGFEALPEGCRVADDLNTVYNYHIRKLLDDLHAMGACSENTGGISGRNHQE